MASILIVDDDLQIQKLLKQILEKEGHETMVAADGLEAMRKYKQKRPDLLITDIVMPKKEGIELIMELKQLEPDVKIIAMSGGGQVDAETYLAMANKLGAKATIGKPLDRKELLSKVKSALSSP